MNVENTLVKSVAAQHPVTQAQAKAIISTVMDELAKGIAAGAVIRGLGTFKVKHVPAHTGRDPRTGEAIPIAAKNRITFKPAAALLAAAQ